MENREKTAIGLTISKSSVTLVSGFSGAAEMESTLQEEKQWASYNFFQEIWLQWILQLVGYDYFSYRINPGGGGECVW